MYISKITFRKTYVITDDLVLVMLRKKHIILDKPIYIRQTVLDLSKYIMYELFYKKLKSNKNMFNYPIRLLGGDTDSFF